MNNISAMTDKISDLLNMVKGDRLKITANNPTKYENKYSPSTGKYKEPSPEMSHLKTMDKIGKFDDEMISPNFRGYQAHQDYKTKVMEKHQRTKTYTDYNKLEEEEDSLHKYSKPERYNEEETMSKYAHGKHKNTDYL